VQNQKPDTPKQLAEANAILEAAPSLQARWWHYTASLNTFELVVGEPSAEDNLVLVMASCTFLSGPVAWSAQRLRIAALQRTDAEIPSPTYELRDDTVGFLARSNMFTFKKGWNLLELGSVMFPSNWRSSDA